MDFCKYVNPFYGNFEPELPEPNETASKWFFLKARVGNTTPAAVLPFGMVSACAYTGGYTTGYGPYLPNTYARPYRFLNPDKMTALGFSHFHQSGTGNIVEFYNFSIITPVSGKKHSKYCRYSLTDEVAEPDFYSCKLSGIECKSTVTEKTAMHSFRFKTDKNNSVVFDPLLNGLFKNPKTPFLPLGKADYSMAEGNTAKTAVHFDDGIILYTVVKCENCRTSTTADDGRIIFDINGSSASVRLGFSFVSIEKAEKNLAETDNMSFEEVKSAGQEKWNQLLGKIQIDADKAYKRKFYSNLYHSLVKPMQLANENPFGIDGNCFCDFATLWDMSKTQLPLVFTLYGDYSSKIINSLINIYKRYGHFPISFLLNGCDPSSDNQARCLALNSIYDGYLRGVQGVDWNEALDCMIGDITKEANAPFFKGEKVSDYASHTIDLCIAAYSISQLAKELGRDDVAEKYLKLSEAWISVYDKETGSLYKNGKFYEGCNLNYSFRLLPDMKKRVEIAGGAEKLEKTLDDFFGFNSEPAVQCDKRRYVLIQRKGEARHGFEGFNNETDMETPYNYSFIGKHEKACQIVRSGEKYVYGMDGRGALCGNNDSGALTSLYVVNALGIFPCFGQNRIILGSPAMKGAVLNLSNGNTLKITVENFDENKFSPKQIFFNGKELEEPFITVKELMAGGEIKFIM